MIRIQITEQVYRINFGLITSNNDTNQSYLKLVI
jgi:hypothetical protein